LVRSGTAIAVSDYGYPSVFYATAADVLPRLESPPEANPVWLYDPSDILGEGWAGRTVVDSSVVERCSPEEWLWIVAWDES
jgi:hypothetical protein